MESAAIFDDENHTLSYIPFAQREPYLAVVYVSWLTLATLSGIVGNLLVIGTILTYKTLRRVGNMFIVNLAVTDLLIAGFVDVFNIFGILYGPSIYYQSSVFCEFVGFVCLVGCYCSLLTIAVIAVNRYIHICRHTMYLKIFRLRNTVVMCVLVWILATAIPIALLAGWGGYSFDHKSFTCVWDRTREFSVTLTFALTGVGLPVFAICACYYRIYAHVQSTRAKIQPTFNGTYAENKKRQERRDSARLAKTLFLIFLAIFILWSPYAILINYDFIDVLPQIAHAITLYIAHFNSSVNPWIYAVTNKQFREGFKATIKRYILCCLCSTKETSVAPLSLKNRPCESQPGSSKLSKPSDPIGTELISVDRAVSLTEL